MSPPIFNSWFVYDKLQGDFDTFPTEEKAREAYQMIIDTTNKEVGSDEYDGDEDVILGRIVERAQLVQIGEDCDGGFYTLASCKVEEVP